MHTAPWPITLPLPWEALRTRSMASQGHVCLTRVTYSAHQRAPARTSAHQVGQQQPRVHDVHYVRQTSVAIVPGPCVWYARVSAPGHAARVYKVTS